MRYWLNRAGRRLQYLALGAFAMVLSAAVAAQSGWPLNMPEGVTQVSREVHGLHMQIFWWCVVIGVVVFGIMFASMFLHRKSRGAQAANFHENTMLEIIWTVIPFGILIAIAVPATRTLKEIYNTEDADMDILVTGLQWKWKYEYLIEDGENVVFFSNLATPQSQIRNLEAKDPNYLLEVDEEVVIPVGKKVRFLVTSGDVIHSWWVPDFGVKRDAIPGYIHEAWARVDVPGTYRGQCTELCGKDHAYMPVVVRAVEQAEYDAWLTEKVAAAEAIAEAAKQTLTFDQLYQTGEQVYVQYCAGCHLANGQGIPGNFPAIAGSPISTGPVEGHLNRIVNGGVGMPPFGEQLTPVQLAAVVTFQRNAFGNNMGDQIQPVDVVNYKQSQ